MLILAILVFGMFVGWIAQLLLMSGRGHVRIEWGEALIAGLVGSFVGGMVLSLLAGDGLELRASGLLGSIAGAVLVTFLWSVIKARRTT